MEAKCIRPIALTVVSGVSATIVIPEQFLKDGKFFNLSFVLSEVDRMTFRDLIEGNEVVSIMNGVGGTSYVLENSVADIFYSDRLHIGYCYRIRWGNNGAASSDGTTGLVQHFLCLNTPCCSRPFNPANNAVPVVTA